MKTEKFYYFTDFGTPRQGADFQFENRIRTYLKAWNSKIIPILLTIISTILGFIPFVIGLKREAFWFPLAAGTMGGLLFSLVGIFVLLPIFLVKRKSPTKQPQSNIVYQ